MDGKNKIPMVDYLETVDGCLSCRDRQWSFGRAYSIGCYEGTLRNHVYDLKRPFQLAESFQAGLLLGHQICRQTAIAPSELYDFLVPIPIHCRRYFVRCFNQAEEIGNGVARQTGIPLEKYVLKKGIHQKKQGTLSAKQRIQNVKSGIQIGPSGWKVKQKRILLVDDVMTTGATLAAAAAIIQKKLKPVSIDVAIVARASLV